MKIKIALLLIVFTTSITANEIKFGKVSIEEVSETEHPMEKDADAAILYKKERVFYDYSSEQGWKMIKQAHYRIKIYNKDGFDWATLEIPLYISNSDEERITGVKGYTFNLENGKIVEEKLKKDGLFLEEVNKYRNKASITMPQVKEGSVLDISFDVVSPLYWYMDDFRLQYNIPVNEINLRLDIPQYFVFKRYSRGFYPINVSQSRENRRINVTYRTQDKNAYVGRTSHKSSTLEFFENIYEVNAMNLPSMKEEKYTNNIDNYRTAIKFELAATQFPNSPYKNYSLNWGDVAESIYKFDSFGEELKKTRYFEDDIDDLISTAGNDSEKAKLIFDFVKSKMTWNKYSGVTCDGGVKNAYKENSGNVAEINLMLTAMLRYAGLNANPILVSTRAHGIPLFPTTDGFNYVISGIEIPNEVILLDATDKEASFDVLPTRALNWQGRLVRKDGSSTQVDLVPKEMSKQLVFVDATIAADGSANGKVRTQYTKQIALSFRNNLEAMDEETYLEEMESEYGDLEISQFEVANKDKPSKPIIETCEFYKENQCEIIGDKIYIRPMLYLAQTENPFKLKERKYPVDFTYPKQERFMINLKIPDGYKIESVPEDAAIQLPNGYGLFKFKIVNKGNQLQVAASSEIKTAFFPPEYYEALKEYYKQLVAKQSEKVVLSKI